MKEIKILYQTPRNTVRKTTAYLLRSGCLLEPSDGT